MRPTVIIVTMRRPSVITMSIAVMSVTAMVSIVVAVGLPSLLGELLPLFPLLVGRDGTQDDGHEEE